MKKIKSASIWVITIIVAAFIGWSSREIKDLIDKYSKKEVTKSTNQQAQEGSFKEEPYQEKMEPISAPPNLQSVQIQEFIEGDGAIAKLGSEVDIHYVGRLTSGKVFDSSRRRMQIYSFKIGQAQILPGLELGVMNMKEGGERRIFVPPSLGYGERGAGGDLVPPNSVLVYDIQMLKVKN